MNVTHEQIRAYRLQAHHLDRKLTLTDTEKTVSACEIQNSPPGVIEKAASAYSMQGPPLAAIEKAASACGIQNSPPGAWETALFNRIEGCTLDHLHDALYRRKTLLQAWSFRGVPAIFPTRESDIFLSPLCAQENETPWIYTRGITGALDYLQMSFEALLPLVQKAALYLNDHTIVSKESLDQTLADIVEKDLPLEKKDFWRAPSMYGAPDKQTVGGAAVSFLLRPCSFSSLVVFGERVNGSPSFTSYENWIGHKPEALPDADKILVRKFLHCYGPALVSSFTDWLGSSPKQAKRLWNEITDELEVVQVEGKDSYILASDLENLRTVCTTDFDENKLLMLGAHDPYLDIRDRTVLMENKALHKTVWRTTANPGVILKGGRIVGIWRPKTQKDKIAISVELYEKLHASEHQALEELAAEYTQFRMASLKNFTISE
ncbi:winged helix DNA-binding domain-containing protein [Blautia schinkii]|nr:winged helix DNA-binding domain-containing protein [Blautia schinkii]